MCSISFEIDIFIIEHFKKNISIDVGYKNLISGNPRSKSSNCREFCSDRFGTNSGFILGEEVGSLHSLTHLCQPPLYEGAAKCTYTVAPRVTSCCRQIWIGSYLPTNNFLSTLWILPGWRRIRLLFNDFQPPRDLTCAWITHGTYGLTSVIR